MGRKLSLVDSEKGEEEVKDIPGLQSYVPRYGLLENTCQQNIPDMTGERTLSLCISTEYRVQSCDLTSSNQHQIWKIDELSK
jgi:hypothetical protein